ncbi:MAG: segregation/condensation protein A [Coriobacteriia bacterium]
MSYRVSTEVFEGPFDLLLHLVGRQKVDVREVSVAAIADEYLEHIGRMTTLDLDVASDFLLVAATLLEIKAHSMLPSDEPWEGDFEDISPEDARELLVARLLAYKSFKNAAAELAARHEAESHMHPRAAGIEEPFLRLMPDYLEGVSLRQLALTCEELLRRREVFLLQAEHVASMPISLEEHVERIARSIAERRKVLFSELLASDPRPEVLVVTFLAVLELYKRGSAGLRQDEEFGDIEVVACDVAGAA